MWTREDIRLLRTGLAHSLCQRLFQWTARLLYGIARLCHFFKLRYNAQKRRMEEAHYHRLTSKLAVLVKVALLLSDSFKYLVLVLGVWICVSLVENSGGQNYVMSVAIQGVAFCVLRRILVFLHSQADRRLMEHVLNEIFYITRSIERKFGMVYHCDLFLICVYLFKLIFVYMNLDFIWRKTLLWAIFLYWVLMEYCCLGYFIYQLLLLNWYRNFSYFVERFLEHNRTQSFISGRYHRRLLWLFKLHLRINNLHKCIQQKLAWLPAAIYLAIFASIFNFTLLIECVVYAEDEFENKLYILMDGCLNPSVIPIINVFLLGLCTDRLRSEELMLQHQIVLINILYVHKAFPHNHSLKLLNNELTSLIVHQKLEPLLNVIILDTTCDRGFAFDYFLTVIVTALSFVQYNVSNGRGLRECVTHR